MDPFTIAGITKVGTSLIGGLLGSGRSAPQLDPRLLELWEKEYERRNYTGFMPDKRAYDRSARGMIDEIIADLPMSTDVFDANLAARGIHGSGEAPGHYYSQVVAPVMKAAGNVVNQSQLAYSQAYQHGMIQEEMLHQKNLENFTNVMLSKYGVDLKNFMMDESAQAEFWQNIGGAIGDLSQGLPGDLSSLFKWLFKKNPTATSGGLPSSLHPGEFSLNSWRR